MLLAVVGAASAQERAEAWLRVSAPESAEGAGFVHVVVEPAVEDGRPVTRWSEEGSVLLPGAESGWREEVLLDPDFGLLRGAVRRRSGAAEVDYRFGFDGKVLRRSCAAAALEQTTPWTRDRDAWPAAVLAAGLLRRKGPWSPGQQMSAEALSWNADGARDGLVFSEQGIAVTVLSQGPREIDGRPESCWTLELAPADPPGPATTLVVDRRGLPVELRTPAWTARRVADRAAALAGSHAGHAGRRDPFRPVLTPREMRRVGDAPRTAPGVPLSPAELRTLLDRAQDDLAAMRQAASLPEADREAVLAERSKSLHLAAARIRDTGDPQAVVRIGELLAEAARHYDPARAALATARSVFRDIRDAFEARDAARLARLPGLVQTLQALSASPELSGKPEQATVGQLVEEALPLEKRARVRLEGYERLKDRRPSGVLVVQEPGPFDLELGIDLLGARIRARTTVILPVSHSVVLLGNGSYEEGQGVAGIDGCTIREIRADEVVLDYKGEELRLRIGGEPGPK